MMMREIKPGSVTENTQLSLLLPQHANFALLAVELERLEHLLSRQPRAITIQLRNNRSTLGSIRPMKEPNQGWRVILARNLEELQHELVRALAFSLLYRVHRKAAPPDILKAVAELRELWHHRPVEDPLAASCPLLEAELLLQVESLPEELKPATRPVINWGRWQAVRTLARYDRRRNLIELHASLNSPRVPLAVIKHLVHHELLHAALGPERQGERLVHHHRLFRQMERSIPEYAEAQSWIRLNWRKHLSHYRRKS
jgi:hypothetical protein